MLITHVHLRFHPIASEWSQAHDAGAALATSLGLVQLVKGKLAADFDQATNAALVRHHLLRSLKQRRQDNLRISSRSRSWRLQLLARSNWRHRSHRQLRKLNDSIARSHFKPSIALLNCVSALFVGQRSPSHFKRVTTCLNNVICSLCFSASLFVISRRLFFLLSSLQRTPERELIIPVLFRRHSSGCHKRCGCHYGRRHIARDAAATHGTARSPFAFAFALDVGRNPFGETLEVKASSAAHKGRVGPLLQTNAAFCFARGRNKRFSRLARRDGSRCWLWGRGSSGARAEQSRHNELAKVRFQKRSLNLLLLAQRHGDMEQGITRVQKQPRSCVRQSQNFEKRKREKFEPATSRCSPSATVLSMG